MRLSLLVIVFGILLISAIFTNFSFATNNDFAINKYHFVSSNSDNNDDRLQICCSWSTKLSDWILTYSINVKEEEKREAIVHAIKEWDRKIERLQLIEEQNPSASDIQIVFGELDDDETGNQYYDFKSKVDDDLTLIPSAGWTQFTFDKQGFIEGTKIIISEDVIDQGFDDYLIEQIVKHELGHALGLGHANHERSLMANLVLEDETGTISECEVKGVFAANSWKFIQSKQNPEHHQRMSVLC
jgi:hypothetical protein